ncbi:MAG TPA: NAD(P)/FAD-dependent oxidoreductase [Rhodothermales bacterium]|nr:NAD(P)/FAD-dependent oxidoreductase [Rhodothermales bacterium]
MYDVIVVGGGPAGLSAALVLGRCRRDVLLIDEGKPRNRYATAVHGFLTRDGIDPHELLRLGRGDLERYGIERIDQCVSTARRYEADGEAGSGSRFEVILNDGRRFESRKLLLATGVRDNLPDIPGLERYYGRGVHHCPYCDGCEYADQSLVACGKGHDAVGLALSLLTWSPHVTTCTDGEEPSQKDRDRLDRHGVILRTEKIIRLEGTSGPDGVLERVVLSAGDPIPCAALFFSTGHVQHSDLPVQLGCEVRQKDEIQTSPKQRTGVPGLFLAGDADGDVQFVVVAASEGAKAAVAINVELQTETLAMV